MKKLKPDTFNAEIKPEGVFPVFHQIGHFALKEIYRGEPMTWSEFAKFLNWEMYHLGMLDGNAPPPEVYAPAPEGLRTIHRKTRINVLCGGFALRNVTKGVWAHHVSILADKMRALHDAIEEAKKEKQNARKSRRKRN